MTGFQGLTKGIDKFLWISEPYFDLKLLFCKVHYIKPEPILKRLQELFEAEVGELQYVLQLCILKVTKWTSRGFLKTLKWQFTIGLISEKELGISFSLDAENLTKPKTEQKRAFQTPPQIFFKRWPPANIYFSGRFLLISYEDIIGR